MRNLLEFLADRPAQLDYRKLDWSAIKRMRYVCYQRFYYEYPGPIRDLYQRLMVIPPERYGDQVMLEHGLSVSPHTAQIHQFTDPFGNQVWELAVPHVERDISFDVSMMVERKIAAPSLHLTRKQIWRFYDPTELTAADDRLATAAHDLAEGVHDPEAVAERLSTWVADNMAYGSGATTVETTAAQATAIGKGLCQDYAHIMLALCRVLGMPARYVSGHMLADGGSHAWVEVLIPEENGIYRPVPFDPTNRRRPDLSYAIVAVGRDYRDVPPTSGSFNAPYGGQLHFTKRAHLALVEYLDGSILES